MSSIIHRLSRSLPNAASAEPLYDPPYLDLADRVIAFVGTGRSEDLRVFFTALEAAYVGRQTPQESNALNEGFMESLIYGLERESLSPVQVYRHLMPKSRTVWEAAWRYTHGDAWPESFPASD